MKVSKLVTMKVQQSHQFAHVLQYTVHEEYGREMQSPSKQHLLQGGTSNHQLKFSITINTNTSVT